MKQRIVLVFILFSLVVSGQFGPPIRISKPSALNIQSIDLGDLDSDGIADLVVASGWGVSNYGNEKLSWFKNYGNNTFNESVVLSTDNDQGYLVKCSDVDLDGDLDLIYSSYRTEFTPPFGINSFGYLSVYKNNGLGQFEEYSVFQNIPSFITFFLDDVNSDGYEDIVLSNYIITNDSDTLFPGYILNDGAGQFMDYVEVSQFLENTILWAGKLNDDTISDFIQKRSFTPLTDSVQISYSSLSGGFENTTIFSNCTFFTPSPHIEDINNDGYYDLLYWENGIKVRYGDSNYLWALESTIFEDTTSFSSAAVIYKRINNDDIKDIFIRNKLFIMDSLMAVASEFTSDIYPSPVINYEQNQTYLYSFPSGSSFSRLAFSYIDADTVVKQPLSISNEFLTQNNIDQIKDLNNDGIMDFASVDFIYLSNSLNTYDKVSIGYLRASNNHYAGFEWGNNNLLFCHLNEDALYDIIYRKENGDLYYSIGSDNFTFTSETLVLSQPIFSAASYMFFGSLFNTNLDKYLVTFGEYETNPINDIIQVFKYNLNEESFSLIFSDTVSSWNVCLNSKDYNLDDNIDLIYFDMISNKVIVRTNNGFFPFSYQDYSVDQNFNFDNLVIKDFNSDGFLDFAVIGSLSDLIKVSTYTYRPDLNTFMIFSEKVAQNEIISSYSQQTILSDVDCDGDFDLLFSNQYNYPNLFYIESIGEQFSSDITIINDSLNGSFFRLRAVDYDLDYDDDLIVSSTSTEQLFLFQNNCSLITNSSNYAESESEMELYVIPNPICDNKILIEFNNKLIDSKWNYSIYSIEGFLIKEGMLETSNEVSFDTDLASGIYFLELRNSNSERYYLKFIKS